MKIELIETTLDEYPVIQNLARFYVYDTSLDLKWNVESDGLFLSLPMVST